MEKRGLIIVFAILLIGNVNAVACDLNLILLNQDPYPAVQGDYVKLLFQAQGIQSSDCKDLSFTLLPEYPFSLDPGADATISIAGGTFTNDYDSFLMIPYRVRIDENAIDGNNTIRLKYTTETSNLGYVLSNFSVEVKELKTNFQIFVKEYNPDTNVFTLEILNSGKNNVEGLTLELPVQDNIKVKGPQYKIIGALDSNDFTTATYEAIPSKGEIKVTIQYTDSIYKRRTLEKTVYFDPEPFSNRTASKKSNYTWIYVLILIIIGFGYWYYRKKQHEKRKKLFS